MQKSYKVLKEAINKTGAKGVAAKMGLSLSLVYKWCQDPEDDQQIVPSGAMNPLDRVKTLYECTQDPEIISWLCQQADGFFTKNPTVSGGKSIGANVLGNVHGLIKEFSEALEAISQSYNDDKSISKEEALLIRKEWEDLKGLGESFVRECESGRFDKKD